MHGNRATQPLHCSHQAACPCSACPHPPFVPWQVSDALDLSKKTLAKIQQNLVWAFGYNAIGIPLAAGALLPSMGIALTPSLSGALMGLSSLAVMGNSLLLQLETRGPSAVASVGAFSGKAGGNVVGAGSPPAAVGRGGSSAVVLASQQPGKGAESLQDVTGEQQWLLGGAQHGRVAAKAEEV